MSLQDSTFEGGIGDWAVNANCTLAASTAQAHTGTGSMTLTSAAAGTMSAKSAATGLAGFPVTPLANYAISAWFLAAATGRNVRPGIGWYDGTGTQIGSNTFGPGGIQDSTTAWTYNVQLAQAPANAATGVMLVQVNTPAAAGEVHYVDDCSVSPVFPQAPLGITVELLLGGTWTDITGFVYQRDNITITRGRPDETSQIQPASMALTFNNQNGDFSPANANGTFYPFIGRNTQIRVSVTSNSVTGDLYAGYRFWGEVSSWPPQWDPSGTDVYVQIQAGGLLRRYSQGASLGSALTRYYNLLDPADAPVAWWPCEDQAGASAFSSAVPGGQDMTWTGNPTLASDSGFFCADPLPLISKSAWTGQTGSFLASGEAIFSAAGDATWKAPLGITSVNVRCVGGGGGGGGGFVRSGSTHAGGAGGGGEFAQEPALAVTPGKTYGLHVGAGGNGGRNGGLGGNGANTTFKGDSVTVTAHGGSNDTGGGGGGAGGTGSANTTHHPGGHGGAGSSVTGSPAGNYGGGGGGGSGGSGATGNAGNAGTLGTAGQGAAPVTFGGPGGDGGHPFQHPYFGSGGGRPGGGGGGGSVSAGNTQGGGNGAAGKVDVTYASASIPGNVVVRCLLAVPSTGAVGGATLMQFTGAGTIGTGQLYYQAGAGGSLGFKMLNSVGTPLADSGLVFGSVNGALLMVSMELAASGANIAWTLTAMNVGTMTILGGTISRLFNPPFITGTGTGTIAGTMGSVTSVTVNPGGTVDDTAIGQLTVQYSLVPLTDAGLQGALAAHNGELAGNRFLRLCSELNIAGALEGQAADTPQMGPQSDDTLLNLLQQVEDADQGLLSELTGEFGLGYRTRVSMQNQSPAAELDYSAAQLAGQLAPTDDDQLTRNDVTVSRTGGGSAEVTLNDGSALSAADPPDGVGLYAYQLLANLYADSQCNPLANWILLKGTAGEERYPLVTVDLTRPEVATFFDSLPAVSDGDFIQVDNPPAFLRSAVIRLLAFGFTETLNAFAWTITFNAVPEDVYEGDQLPTW